MTIKVIPLPIALYHSCYNVANVHGSGLGILNTNILLSHAIYPSLWRCSLVPRSHPFEGGAWGRDYWRDRVRVSNYIAHCLCSAMPLDWVAITKFKTMKINSEGLLWLSTKLAPPKITRHDTIWTYIILCTFSRAHCMYAYATRLESDTDACR